MILTIIAVLREKSNTGIRKVNAIINFAANVVAVAFQICFFLFFLSDSSLMWIPSASLNASAIAIVRIPPMTINLSPVAADSPMKSPRVVMIADVNPKDTPTFVELFI